MVTMIIILANTYLKDFFRTPNKSAKVTKILLTIFTLLTITDLIIVTIGLAANLKNPLMTFPWVAEFLRPLVILINFRKIRSYAKRYIQVIRTTFPMSVFIGVYVEYFALSNRFLTSVSIAGTVFSDNSKGFFV
jgi:hypothetical protein